MTNLERLAPVAASALVFAALGATFLANWPIRFPLDDAYITLANARLLLQGGSDSYGNTGPTGATSLIHLLSLTGLGRLLPLTTANLILATVALLAYALGLWRLTRLLGANRLVAAGVMLAGLTASNAWFQLFNGLETGIAMAAVTWCAVGLIGQPSPVRALGLGILIGALPFIRPELAALAGFSALALLVRLRGTPVRLVAPALGAIATAALLTFAGWALTGQVIPLTAGAKTAFFAESAMPLGDRAAFGLQILLLNPVAPFLAGMLLLPFLTGGWALIGFAVTFVLAAVLSLPGGLAHNEFRYLYAFLPLGLAGWAWLTLRPGMTGRIASMALALLIGLSVASFPLQGWPYWRASLNVTDDQESLARWAEAHLPAESRILIHDAGFLAWRTEFPLIDAVGLKTPEVIEIHRAITLPSAGLRRAEALDTIARVTGVTHAVILDRPFWADIATNLRGQGWVLVPLRPEAADVIYQLYALTPPTGARPTD